MGRRVRFLRDIIYAWRVRRTLIDFAPTFIPDIVEYADIDAEALFHPPICPYVVKLHTPHVILRQYYSDREVPYARAGIEKIEKRAICQADGVSSPSRYLADEISRIYGLNGTQIQWAPNPIDTEFFSPNYEIGKSSYELVLFVGRLETLKGAKVFAHAIAEIAEKVPNTRFVLLGADRLSVSGGSQKTELIKIVQDAGVLDRVEFHGHAEPEVFRDFYRKATVFVIPSLYENCPYTLLEAMACGKPVVVSQTGGMLEMVENEKTGLFFKVGNSSSLAEKTIQLLKSPRKRKLLGQKARKHIINKYSLSLGAKITESFYQKVISKDY